MRMGDMVGAAILNNGLKCLSSGRHIMAKTIRARLKIVDFLKGRDEGASFQEIRDFLNANTRHGITQHSLGNVLAKNPEFMQVGTTHVQAIQGGHYEMTTWMLTEEVVGSA